MSKLQEKLKQFSTSNLFTAKGDEICSAKKYYSNGLDCLLAEITKAAIADGMDPKTVTRLFANHAEEALDKAATHTPIAHA